jgi:hypothetical protein
MARCFLLAGLVVEGLPRWQEAASVAGSAVDFRAVVAHRLKNAEYRGIFVYAMARPFGMARGFNFDRNGIYQICNSDRTTPPIVSLIIVPYTFLNYLS